MKNTLISYWLIVSCLFVFIGIQAQNSIDSVTTNSIDSIFQTDQSSDKVFIPEIELTTTKEEMAQLESLTANPNQRNPNWYQDHAFLFYIYCIILSIYAFIRWRYHDFFEILRRSVSNIRMAQIDFDDTQNQFSIPMVLLYLNTILVLGILLYHSLQYIGVEHFTPFWKLLCYSLGLSLGFFIFKLLIQRFLAIILPISTNIHFYLYNKLLIQIVQGITILPFVILLSFNSLINPIFLFLLVLGLTTFISIYQAYRGFSTNTSLFKLYPFHFFLYLCALEIAPILLLLKFHQNLAS